MKRFDVRLDSKMLQDFNNFSFVAVRNFWGIVE